MNIEQSLSIFPQTRLMMGATPIEPLARMSDLLGIDLWMKRDDLTTLSFGGNKTRQLEYYFGDAISHNADTILITGAVQSNFVRAAAACAAKLGMKAVLQLEERVPDMGERYYKSGNVLLAQILGAEHLSYPLGEDEAGADNALAQHADQLRSEGRKPYVIHLGIDHPPLGALGYVSCAQELSSQIWDVDAVIVPSGSGATHSGLLTGLRMAGQTTAVFGICVRREATLQHARIDTVLRKLTALLKLDSALTINDIHVWDGALAPGYGRVNDSTREALTLMARTEGIFLDPVYTAKTFAGLLGLIKTGIIEPGQKVVLLHTGGLPALFGYEEELI